jgi:hypothetical protein
MLAVNPMKPNLLKRAAVMGAAAALAFAFAPGRILSAA